MYCKEARQLADDGELDAEVTHLVQFGQANFYRRKSPVQKPGVQLIASDTSKRTATT